MKTTVGKLRNITSGILHTEIKDVYIFFEEYAGQDGIMTHQLPSACRAIEPILKRKLPGTWFTHEWIKEGLTVGVIVPDMTDDEAKEYEDSFQKLSSEMWDSIKDKTVIVKV